MTLKEAYIKIDNTLCLNQIRGNLEFNINKEYNEGYNEDCKDPIEMVSALETIRKYLVIEGCPLETYIKLHNKAHIYDVEGKPLKVLQVLSDTVVVKDLQDEKIFLSLNNYKNSWWLKEDKSE